MKRQARIRTQSIRRAGERVEPVAQVVRDNNVTTVRLAGDLDMATVPTVSEVLESEYQRHPVRLTLDLAEVEFLDASALHLFVALHRRLPAEGCDLVIADPSDVVIRTMQLARLDRLLTVVQPKTRGALAQALNREVSQVNERKRRNRVRVRE
jgi:anti-sigma B factor antagonist